MLAVGIRDLKKRLSEFVRRAREGEVILVTDRGRVVAELRAPISVRGLPPGLVGLEPLVERGVVTLGQPGPAPYPASPLRAPDGTASALLDAERADR